MCLYLKLQVITCITVYMKRHFSEYYVLLLHVQVIWNVWRLPLTVLCKRLVSWHVTARQPLRSTVDKQLHMATNRDTVSVETSECARFKCLRCWRAGLCGAFMGTAGWSSTRRNTGSRGQGTATRVTLSSTGEPLNKAHRAPFRGLHHISALFWRGSKGKLSARHERRGRQGNA